MNRTLRAALAVLVLVAPACRREPAIERVPSSQYTPPSTVTPPVTSPATPTPVLASGTPSPTCVRGWLEPSPGTAFESEPLDALRRMQGLNGSPKIVELRYFLGPDDANLSAESKQKRPVERWYGKVTVGEFRVRFLYVRREFSSGVVAIAPYATKGFAGKDWMGFDGEGGARAYPGVPGKWPGTPYDYRAAGELPPEVTGCLAGT